MNTYTLFNLALAAVLLPASYWLAMPQSRRAEALLASRIGVLVTLLSYPWDFFAIQRGVWRYPIDPGVDIYGVPVNDLFFIWQCTYFTSSVLLRLQRGQAGSEGHAESKDASY